MFCQGENVPCAKKLITAKCCRSSRKGNAVSQIQQPNESAPFVLSVNSVTSISKPFKTYSLQLGDTVGTRIIDIGATVSILNDSLYRKHFAYPLHRLRELCQYTTVVKSHWRDWYIYQSHTSQKISRNFRSMSPGVVRV